MRLRIISGLILYICASGIILYAHPLIFFIFLALLVGLVSWEWLGLLRFKPKQQKYLLSLAALPIGGGYFLSANLAAQPLLQQLVIWLSGFWLLSAIISLWLYPRRKQLKPRVRPLWGILNMLTALSMFYLFSLEIYKISPYLAYTLFSLVVVYDTGGYIFGKLIGGKKITPQISPNKTYSGTLGATVLSILTYWLLTNFTAQLSMSLAVILALVLVTSCLQLGDLYQSMLKRAVQQKNSGTVEVIPGHGGVFDRVDALLWGSFPFYIFINYLPDL